MDMLKQFSAARLVSVPIVAIQTADQMAAIVAVTEHLALDKQAYPIVQWDAARGITPVGNAERSPGAQALIKAGIKAADTIGFVEAMLAAQLLPRTTILFAHNAHRQLQSQEPAATAAAVQAVANLRDSFKRDFRMLVLLAPAFAPPPELGHDIVVLHDPLPDPDHLRTIVGEVCASAKASSKAFCAPDEPGLVRAVDAVSGLSSFEAEQVVSMSLTDTGLDFPAMWEQKRSTIEQTPGLSVYRGTETLDDLRGLASVKARLRAHIHAKTPIGVVCWVDEGADVFANVDTDTSGVKTDQQRALLVEMEEHGWRGIIGVGVPGSGKSAIARGFGNEAGVPTIQVDFGDMESKYVGESEGNLRRALNVIKAVGRGHAFFMLTCNSLRGIRPQFQRRFKRGIFFFDLPTAEERAAIWALYRGKYAIAKQDAQPDDDGWTGSEIRECCESAWDTGVTLLEAAQYIVPVSRSRATEIEQMRAEANGRFLDASHPGAYHYTKEPMAKQIRAIALEPPAVDLSAMRKVN